MGRTFFGFAMSDSMFQGNLTLKRTVLSVDDVRNVIEQGIEPCVNPSHVATLAAMKERFGLAVEVPAVPPRVELHDGDSLVVMAVRGLPRLTDRHEYTNEEVAQATFTFARWDCFSIE